MIKISHLKLLSPFLVALILFLTVDNLIRYSSIGAYLEKEMTHALQFKESQMKDNHPYHMDILFLGTSRTLHGFATTAFEKDSPIPLNAFNMGFTRSNVLFSKLMLQHEVQTYAKPKLVLLEISEFNFDPDAFSERSNLYIAHQLALQPNFIWLFLSDPEYTFQTKQESLLSWASSIYRYRSLLSPKSIRKTLEEGSKNAPQKTGDEDNNIFKGWFPLKQPSFMESNTVIKATANYKKNLFWGSKPTFNPIYLASLLAYCKKENIPITLIKWPLHPIYYQVLNTDPNHLQFEKTLSNLMTRYHTPLIDMNQFEPANSRWFADVDHLNEQGSLHYTDLLCKAIFKDEKIASLLKHKQYVVSAR